MGKFKSLYQVQFLETILCILTSSSIFIFLLLAENEIANRKNDWLEKAVAFVGNCTLEIYLVQFPIIDFVGELQIPSVLKFVMAVSLIIGCAYLLKTISGYIIKRIKIVPNC